MRRLVVVEHEVDGVCRCGDEDDLEHCVVKRRGQVKGPEQVDVPGNVDEEVEEL